MGAWPVSNKGGRGEGFAGFRDRGAATPAGALRWRGDGIARVGRQKKEKETADSSLHSE